MKNKFSGYLTKITVVLIFQALISSTMIAQDLSKFPTAQESDPIKLGWMLGFPPAKDKVIQIADGSFYRFPEFRWTVTHMRDLLPTTNVYRGTTPVSALPNALDPRIDAIQFTPWGSNNKMSWKESLLKNYTDGILILHKGKIVYEHYFSSLTPGQTHVVMSLTKSFTGTLAAILAAEGKLDVHKKVVEYVPELKNSAFEDATVREVMDMTTALQFSEDYANPNAEIWQFSNAGNPFPKPKDYKGPVGYYEYLKTVKKSGEHGKAFGYKTVNADVLGWIISKISNQSVAQLLQEKIWKPLGMEQDAYYQVDGVGTPFAGGGLNAGLRDLARFGELIRNKGMWKGKQLIPDAAVEDIMKGGSKEAFAKAGYENLKGWSYRNMWWMTENADGAFTARGVHGQTIYIDPKAEMVIVRLASHPIAANGANDATSLPAFQAVADYLMKTSGK